VTDIVESPEVSTLLDELTHLTGREDPYPRYHRLREISPVVRAEDGALVVTRHADCVAVTRHPKLGHMPSHMLEFVRADWADHPALHQLFTSVLALNPPDHTRLRRLVSSSFTARRVQALRPRIAQMVQDLLVRMDGEVDFIEAFAFPLPVNVIGELLGIPEPDRAQFQGLVRDWTQVLEVITQEALATADPAAATIREYLAGLAAERRRKPGDDLISALVAAEEDGEKLTEDELLTMAGLLFAAGFETTTNLLGNGVVALLRHPDQLELLRRQSGAASDSSGASSGSAAVAASGALAASAVEELLRFDSPVQLLSRVAWDDVEIAGVPLPGGERIVAYLGAGNRDPERFTDPDRLDLTRPDNAPLSFGGGIHYCLGAPLARLEAQIAFPALLARFPRLELAGEPARRDSLAIRGYTSLPISVG
jgi:cytochrome P450